MKLPFSVTFDLEPPRVPREQWPQIRDLFTEDVFRKITKDAAVKLGDDYVWLDRAESGISSRDTRKQLRGGSFNRGRDGHYHSNSVIFHQKHSCSVDFLPSGSWFR